MKKIQIPENCGYCHFYGYKCEEEFCYLHHKDLKNEGTEPRPEWCLAESVEIRERGDMKKIPFARCRKLAETALRDMSPEKILQLQTVVIDLLTPGRGLVEYMEIRERGDGDES